MWTHRLRHRITSSLALSSFPSQLIREMLIGQLLRTLSVKHPDWSWRYRRHWLSTTSWCRKYLSTNQPFTRWYPLDFTLALGWRTTHKNLTLPALPWATLQTLHYSFILNCQLLFFELPNARTIFDQNLENQPQTAHHWLRQSVAWAEHHEWTIPGKL